MTGGPRKISVVDSHTCGQPTRVIVGGIPEIRYTTVAEARDVLRGDYDWVRRLAVFEPHGHRSLFAAALIPTSDPTAVQGVVFMDAAGYHDMCGHATIGVATTLVERGLIDVPEGESEFSLDTPAGLIGVRVQVEGGRARSVTFVNQPAYFLESVSIDSPQGPIEVHIAFGGQWYAFVDARSFELEITPENVSALVSLAAELRPLIQGALVANGSRTDPAPHVENIMWVDNPPSHADGRNMPVNIAGGFDRSPCGTGTSARLAVLQHQGALAVGETYVNAGVLGTVYQGRIASETNIGLQQALIPEITGSAWITGQAELWVAEDDPVPDGFLL
ncbi:MAG TPA: proline racemase family protein [Galbitalea sp.]